MLRQFTGLFAALLLSAPVGVRAGDVQSVRVSAGKVMAVKDFLKGLPSRFGGHKAAAIASLEAAEAELWKAIKAGGASAAVRADAPAGGRAKLAKSIAFLQDVRRT
jgi:hypothetical protein